MARDLEALYADLEGQVRSKTDDLMVLNDMLNYQKRELKVALDRLGDEVAYKNEFFAIVSHELRTPLTSILAYARILNADDSLAPKTREAVGEIESNATLLLNMVNNILVISKHAAKKDEPFARTGGFRRFGPVRAQGAGPYRGRQGRETHLLGGAECALEHGRLGEAAAHSGEPGEQCYQVHPSRWVRAPDDWVRGRGNRLPQ